MSLPPVASLIAPVAGDRFRVVALLPPGRSPHDYEPTPHDLEPLRSAMLFVRVGGAMDPWMARVAQSLGAGEDNTVTLSAHAGEDTDPHLWLDLDTVFAFLPAFRDRLIEVDPEGADGYRIRTRELIEDLERLDTWARSHLAPVSDIPFVLMHPAFSGLMERYDMTLVSVLEKHSHGEPSARALADAVHGLRDQPARVIFADMQQSSRPSDTLAGDIAGTVAFLDPIGGAGTGRESYLELMRWNVIQIEEHLRAGH